MPFVRATPELLWAKGRTRGVATVLKLSFWSSFRRLLPEGLVSEHRIENDQQVAHASGQCHLLLFAGTKQTKIEGFDTQFVFSGHERRHVKCSAHACTTASGSSFAVPLTAITRMRRKAAESPELL